MGSRNIRRRTQIRTCSYLTGIIELVGILFKHKCDYSVRNTTLQTYLNKKILYISMHSSHGEQPRSLRNSAVRMQGWVSFFSNFESYQEPLKLLAKID